MATIRLPIRIQLGSSGWSNFGVSSTSEGVPVGFTLPTSFDQVSALYDESDFTYMRLVGNASAGAGVAGTPGSIATLVGSIGNLVPQNSTISAGRFVVRARKTSCDSATLYAFRGASGVPLSENTVSSFQITTPEFADYVHEMPFMPGFFPPTTWASRGSAVFADIYNTSSWGVLVASDCPGGGNIGVDVSELALEVDVVPPTPIVTTGQAQSKQVSAVLNGTVNPNQSQVVLTGINGFISTFFPVRWQFYFGLTPTTLTAVGSPQGEFYCGPPNNNATPDFIDHPIATSRTWAVSTEVNDLSPLTTYYYALAAIVDGIITLGTTQSFKTPGLDSSLGAF